MATFNGVELTDESMQKAREALAANDQCCIDEVSRGEVHVNDPEAYFAWCRTRASDALSGRLDSNFTLLQRAHTIQTGECIAFLP